MDGNEDGMVVGDSEGCLVMVGDRVKSPSVGWLDGYRVSVGCVDGNEDGMVVGDCVGCVVHDIVKSI